MRAPMLDYLGRLRRRALAVRAVRDALRATAAGTGTAVAVGWTLGPTPPLLAVALGWIAIAGAVIGAIWSARRGDPSVRGPGAASLLAERAPALVSAARTARELELGAPEGASVALASAHRSYVLAALEDHPPSRVVPLRTLGALENRVAAAVALGATVVLAMSASVRAGAFALTHPGLATAEGHRIAAMVRIDAVRISPPAYTGEAPRELGGSSQVAALRGSVIEMDVRALSGDVTALELRFADGRTLPVPEGGAGSRTVRFIATASTSARFRAHAAGTQIEDAATLVLDVSEDRAPTVRLTEPESDRDVDLGDMVLLVADAEDDLGLESLEIVVTTLDGEETRHPFTPSAELPQAASGIVPVLVSELGAEPGDTITIHAEARDRDDVSGPHVTRSPTRTLRLRSEADLADQALSTLEQLREAALGLLADRLESPPPEPAEEAAERFAVLARTTELLLDGLSAVASGALEGAVRATDQGVYQEVERRLARELDRERRLHRPLPGALDARAEADTRAVRELESAVLTLSSLLLRARADDAAAIARELESLRRQMASLVAELRRARTPEAMRELAATIARARRRVAELRERMARMGEGTPREFENLSEEDVARTEEALARMEQALEGDDLDAAARALTGLEQEIDQLARALGQSQEALAEERFGERERALADVIDRLMSLEAEQRELAARTATAQRSAADRAIAAEAQRASAAAAALVDDAQGAAAPLEGNVPRGVATSSREAWEAARERLHDAEAALSAGDLGEARRMAAEATITLEDLGRSLDLDAMMFPGHDGELSDSARAVRDAERRSASLERAIEGAIPDLGRHLAEGERAQLRTDVARQASAREATSALEARLERLPMGPSGAEIAEGLHEVAGRMSEAESGLRSEDAHGAARAQDEAGRRLTEIRRRIETEQQNQGGGGGDGQTQLSRETVVIPGADSFETPMEARRRVLDAMGDPAPGGFEDAIRRYYEGLLR